MESSGNLEKSNSVESELKADKHVISTTRLDDTDIAPSYEPSGVILHLIRAKDLYPEYSETN